MQLESFSEILSMIMTLPINKYSILLGTTTCRWEKNWSINNGIISLKIIFKPRYCLKHCNPRVLQGVQLSTFFSFIYLFIHRFLKPFFFLFFFVKSRIAFKPIFNIQIFSKKLQPKSKHTWCYHVSGAFLQQGPKMRE